ncbi:MAG: alpha/beta fold hydrolase [Planctomycetia bacterium]|nr:alpha/beta fold hydrolase [Planctomycetia bacterium]
MRRSTIVVSVLAGVGGVAIVSTVALFVWLAYTVSQTMGRPRAMGGPMWVAPSGEIAQRHEDYGEARASFRTKLLRAGPSPQPLTEAARIPAGTQQITFHSGELQLAAHVDVAPAHGVKRPAVLFLHGGFAFGGDDLEMPQPFRDAGYVVMMPVLRGENGQPGTVTMCYEELDDVFAAADALAALPYVDSERLFVAGHHAGGTLAMQAAMMSARFRAAATFSGTCDARFEHLAYTPFDRSDPREFEMRSPAAFATSLKCPLRLYYGNQEPWAATPTSTTVDRARRAGLDVDSEMVPGNHMTHVPESIRRAVEFFRRSSTAEATRPE